MKFRTIFSHISRPQNLLQSILETITLNLILYAILIILFPKDPLMIEASFPWFVFVPVFMGLMYGTIVSLINIFILVVAVVFMLILEIFSFEQIPIQMIAGTSLLIFVSGEFKQIWENKIVKLKNKNEYIKLRLDEFTKSYYQIKISHDEIERRFITSSYNIKGTINTLKNNILSIPKEEALAENSLNQMLKIFINQFDIYRAGIYIIDQNENQKPKLKSSFGKNFNVSYDDPMIQDCIKHKQLLSIKTNFEDLSETKTKLKVVIPFIDSQKKIWAIMAIEDMPFYFFNNESFRVMAITGSYLADIINIRNQIKGNINPIWAEFALNLKRLICINEKFNFTSTIIAIEVKKEKKIAEELKKYLNSNLGGLDLVITQNTKEKMYLLILFPFAEKIELNEFIDKINKFIKQKIMQNLTPKILSHELVSMEKLKNFTNKELNQNFEKLYLI